ncbi:MAG: hypothetical protein ACLFVQ_00800 [Chitinispirillaceae bacterium]
MRKTAISFLVLFVTAGAQSPLGLHLPAGMPVQSVTGLSSSMSGSGTGVKDENMGINLNPANMAMPNRSAFSSLISYDLLQIKEKSTSSTTGHYSPRMLSLILPAGSAGNIAFSLEKRNDAAIDFLNKDVNIDNENAYRANYIGITRNGGLTSFQGGWGYSIKNGPSFGILYERLYFNLSSSSIFGSEISDILDSSEYEHEYTFSEDTEMSYSSNGVRMGMLVPIGKLSVGLSGEYIFYTEGDLKRTYQNLDSTENSSSDFYVHLPPSLSAGIGYRPDSKWLLAADLHATLWERYRTELGLARPLRRAYRVSAGARFIPAPNKLAAEYWETVQYRAGVRYNQLPFDDAQEYAISLGAGLPIANDDGLIDVIFEFGKRSDSRFPDYSENIIRMQLGINGGRDWFRKNESNY